MSRNHAKGISAARSVRCAKALELRVTGGSYRQIGAALGVGLKTAYYDVQRELGKLDAVNEASAERVRDLELARLDRITIALWPRAGTGDPRAVTAMIRVMDRRAKLLGLDAPARVEVVRPDRPFADLTVEEIAKQLRVTARILGSQNDAT